MNALLFVVSSLIGQSTVTPPNEMATGGWGFYSLFYAFTLLVLFLARGTFTSTFWGTSVRVNAVTTVVTWIAMVAIWLLLGTRFTWIPFTCESAVWLVLGTIAVRYWILLPWSVEPEPTAVTPESSA